MKPIPTPSHTRTPAHPHISDGERRRRGEHRDRAMIEALVRTGTVRRARVGDAGEIQRLITTFADRDEMLHRSLGEIYENIRDFYVAEDADGRVVGCGGLHVCWSHLAEIKSLAVDE